MTPCPFCDGTSVARVRGLQGFREVILAVALTLCLVVPGVLYYIWIESIPYCSGCGRRVRRSRSNTSAPHMKHQA